MRRGRLEHLTDVMTVSMESALLSQLSSWGIDPATDPLAASALDMARTLDDPSVSATPRSMLHAQFRQTIQELSKAAPVEQTNDGIDEVQRKREARRSA